MAKFLTFTTDEGTLETTDPLIRYHVRMIQAGILCFAWNTAAFLFCFGQTAPWTPLAILLMLACMALVWRILHHHLHALCFTLFAKGLTAGKDPTP